MDVIYHFVDLYILSYASRIIYHTFTLVVCNDLGGVYSKFVQWHLRPLKVVMHTFRGSCFLNNWIFFLIFIPLL